MVSTELDTRPAIEAASTPEAVIAPTMIPSDQDTAG